MSNDFKISSSVQKLISSTLLGSPTSWRPITEGLILSGCVIGSGLSTVEPIMATAGVLFEVCVKVAEALHKVKKNSKAAEALQVRVTSIALILNSKLNSCSTTDAEINTMNALLKTLNETREWVEKRLKKEETQLTLHQMFKAKDTEEKIKAFDERLSNHMIDLNVVQSVALDFKAANASYEMQGLIQWLSDSQKALAEQLKTSGSVWSLDSAVERLGGIEKVITDGLNNVEIEVHMLMKQNEQILDMLKQNQKDPSSPVSQAQPQSQSQPQSPMIQPTKLISWSELKGNGEEIAHGAFGVVRRYTFRGAAVALKELKGASALKPKQIEQFLTEASIQSRLQHPYVVRVYGIAHDEIAGKYGIVQHLMRHGLDKHIEGLSIFVRIEYLCQIAAGINYLHNEDPVIIHGDIKPQNVLVAEGGLTVGLTDFGLSRTKAQLGMTSSAGGLKGAGTLPFMAPELFDVDSDGEPTHKSSKATDVYAFGITAFCILIGLCGLNGPYPDEDENGDVFKVRKAVKAGKRPTDYFQWPTNVPEKFKSVVMQCWEQDEDKRPTMSAVVERLLEGKEKSVETFDVDRFVFVHSIDASPTRSLNEFEKNKPLLSSKTREALEVLPRDANGLVKLMKIESLTNSAKDVIRLAEALTTIAESDTGRQSCVDAGAPGALISFFYEKAVKENCEVTSKVALALSSIASSDEGRQACIDAGAPFVLADLACQQSVKENGETACNVAGALRIILQSEAGRKACVDAGVIFSLIALSQEKSVKGNGSAVRNIAATLSSIASSDEGRQSCIDAGAPHALAALASEKTVKENSSVAWNVSEALWVISESDIGRQSCIDAGALSALVVLSSEKAVKADRYASWKIHVALTSIANLRE
jgi:serine/threonine protein kinase